MREILLEYIRDLDFAGIEAVAEFRATFDDDEVDALLLGLSSEEWRVRMRCSQALGRASGDRVVNALRQQLASDNSSVIREAGKALVTGHQAHAEAWLPDFVEALTFCIEHDEMYSAAALMKAATSLGKTPQLQPVLANYAEAQFATKNPSSYVEDALRALGVVAPASDRTRRLLQVGLSAGDVRVVRASEEVLGTSSAGRQTADDTATESRRGAHVDAHATIEQIYGGHWIIACPSDDPEVSPAWVFVEGELGVGASDDARMTESQRLMREFRSAFAAGEVPGQGRVRMVGPHLEFRMSWGTVLRRWTDGRVETFPQWASDWSEVATGVPMDEFVADCLDRMKLAAHEMMQGGYLAWSRSAKTQEELQSVRDHFEELRELAERVGHRSAELAEATLDRLGKEPVVEVDEEPHAFRAIQKLEGELASLHGEPPRLLLNNLESGYLAVGRVEDAERVRKRRHALYPIEPLDDASFEINQAMSRVAEITNEIYTIVTSSGSLADHVELAKEGAELHQRVLVWWRPHPLAPPQYPQGRATSQASANYLDALIQTGEFARGAAFFREATEDLNTLRAQFRDFPGPAESFFTCGVYCCLESEEPDDVEYASRMWTMATLEQFGAARPDSHFLYARIAALSGDYEAAKQHSRRATELGDEALVAEMKTCPELQDVLSDI